MHVHVTCKYYVYPSTMMDRQIKGNKIHFNCSKSKKKKNSQCQENQCSPNIHLLNYVTKFHQKYCSDTLLQNASLMCNSSINFTVLTLDRYIWNVHTPLQQHEIKRNCQPHRRRHTSCATVRLRKSADFPFPSFQVVTHSQTKLFYTSWCATDKDGEPWQ